MTITASDLFAAMDELKALERRENRIRRRLKKLDCRLWITGNGLEGWSYLAISRTTGGAEFGPVDINEIELWSKGAAA